MGTHIPCFSVGAVQNMLFSWLYLVYFIDGVRGGNQQTNVFNICMMCREYISILFSTVDGSSVGVECLMWEKIDGYQHNTWYSSTVVFQLRQSGSEAGSATGSE